MLLGETQPSLPIETAEDARHACEEHLRIALEVLEALLFEWDPATSRLQWLGGSERLLGFGREELVPDVGWNESRIHPDDVTRVSRGIRLALESAVVSYHDEYRLLHRDGHYVEVVDRRLIVRDASAARIRIIAAISNIRERRALERERDASIRREHVARLTTDAAIRARDGLLGIVSYELRSSLGAQLPCALALS